MLASFSSAIYLFKPEPSPGNHLIFPLLTTKTLIGVCGLSVPEAVRTLRRECVSREETQLVSKGVEKRT